MEKKYLPHIDYALAFACALQLWIKSRENREEAWNAYIRLCETGGSKSFLELVNLANLRSPFEDGCVKSVIGPIKEWLNNINDKNL